MQLHLNVECSWGDEDDAVIEQELTSFDEQEKIAVQIGRKVRDWLRQIPVRRQGDRQVIRLAARWVEGAPRAAGKKKRAKKDDATDGG
jgi:hypothetical protein